MTLLSYRNLAETGGPEYTKDEVKAFLEDKEVFAGPNDEGETRGEDGEPFMRKPILTDRFVSPYQNDKAAMTANGGALPPDLSVMAKARGIPHAASGILLPAMSLSPFMKASRNISAGSLAWS